VVHHIYGALLTSEPYDEKVTSNTRVLLHPMHQIEFPSDKSHSPI